MTKFSESPLYVVLPEGSALVGRQSVTLRELSDQTWILFERKAHPDVHDAILRRAHEEDIAVQNGLSFLNAEEAAQLVAENLGIAFMTETVARRIVQKHANAVSGFLILVTPDTRCCPGGRAFHYTATRGTNSER